MTEFTGVTPDQDAVQAASDVEYVLASIGARVRKVSKADLVALLGAGGVVPPQCRCTLTSGVAVPESDVTGAAMHYVTPVGGGFVPLWNSATSKFDMVAMGGELSQATTDATKSPAAVANNKVYFVHVWDDLGIRRGTRGEPWASDTDPGTGAGTAEVEWINGIPVNKHAITNGPAARKGTIVAALRSNGSAQFTDSELFRWVSNVFNKAPRVLRVIDTTNSWSPTATSTWEIANNNAANKVDVLFAFGGCDVNLDVINIGQVGAPNASIVAGVGVDGLTRTNNIAPPVSTTAAGTFYSVPARYRGYPGQGRHYFNWLQFAGGGGAASILWYGDNGTTNFQSGMVGGCLN